MKGVDRWVGLAAGIATVIAAVVAVVAYVLPRTDAPRETGPGNTGSGSSAPGAASPAGSTSLTPAAPGPAGVYLDTKGVVAGQPRLVPVPAELRDKPGYERAVAIACPSNESGDTQSEITYETNNRYARLTATLHPYRQPPDGVRVDLFVFQDNADRKPGAPTGVGPTQVRVTMGGQAELSAPVDHAYYLRLRLVCERPGGIMILARATLVSN